MASHTTQSKPERAGRVRGKKRLPWLRGALLLWVGVLIVRLYYLQIIDYDHLKELASRQQQHVEKVGGKRGEIYDRQGDPLAISADVTSIFALTRQIPNPKMVAELLAHVLGLDAADLQKNMKGKTFCWVKREVSAEEANRVCDLNLRGIYTQAESKRYYPKGDLAAHILGSVGGEGKGLAGLEYGHEDVLHGSPGKVVVEEDARQRSFHSTEYPGKPGKNLVLTLDVKIQFAAEKALAEAMEKRHAAAGVAIVQNPHTGEILAMASEPTFDPKDFARSKPEAQENRGVSWVYEPGSTFKLVTVAAALEEQVTRPEDVIDCGMGKIKVAGHIIHDHKPFGALTVREVVAKSSDVGAIKLGLRLGPDRLYRYICAFGFGNKTGVELPGEERGMLKPPSGWLGTDIGAISMGQGLGVTPIQLVSAYSSVANGGMLFEPRLMHDIYLDHAHEALPPVPGRRVLTERTANLMKQILAGVVANGTGKSAQLNGYSCAGKTGTAQKIDATGHYSKRNYVASFVGFAPLENPAVTVLVAIDSPVGAIYGADVAAPVFKSIAEAALSQLDVPPDAPVRSLQIATGRPQGRGSEKGRVAGETKGPEESKAVDSTIRTASLTNLGLAEALPEPVNETLVGSVETGAGGGLTVPDFSGWGARRIAHECQLLGVELRLLGSGLAVEQNPRPHTPVQPGARVVVRLARL
jgi:cell division protein FtsI (penicillin-binding protein 3)